MAKTPDVKGRWFDGDRTLAQQLMGLDRLWRRVPGKTVLDVGCAEGEISLECARRGAVGVLGIEIRADAVAAADHQRLHALKGGPAESCWFQVEDANTFTPAIKYDVVLLLAILHKLKDPTAAVRRYAEAAREWVVIRLPPENAPNVVDPRSGNVPHYIDVEMIKSGFRRDFLGNIGPFGEWMGYYRRIEA
jgi:SAM-dependent methyltransferase